jgi:dipeptidase E
MEIDTNLKLLLGSGGLGLRPENEQDRDACRTRREYVRSLVDEFLGRGVRKILLIHYATIRRTPEGLLDLIATPEPNLLGDCAASCISMDAKNAGREIEAAEAFLMWGGNTFVLLHRLQENTLIESIQRKVRAGTPCIGVSAGTNVVCPTIMTTNDMPIVMPKSFNALGLINFQINPHYVHGPSFHKGPSGEFEKYGGETRDDRIQEFRKLNPNKTVVGIPEGSFLKVQDGKILYLSRTDRKAVIFSGEGESPKEFPQHERQMELTPLLQ